MKIRNLGLIAGAAALIGAAAWYLYAGPAGSAAPKSAKAAGKGGAQAGAVVNVVAAVRQDVPVVLQANGTVSPVSSVDVRAQTSALIRRVHIKEGQFVKADEPMFSLDDRAERANVAKAEAQIARDRAALQDLERQYQRALELLAQKFIAQNAVDTLRSALESARALLGSDMAALEAARVSASYASIRAPMAGRVGAINVYPGSLVQPSASLTTITRLDPINVAFALPESSLADVLAAQKKGAVAVEAVAGGGARVAAGELNFIDNTVDPATGSIRVKAQFANRDAQLWPGQYVNARVTVRTLKDAVVVPQAAIITTTRGTFVYVMQADHSVLQVPVRRLHAFDLYAAVSGLAGGEQIITEGKQNVRPGAQVRLAEAAETPRGGARAAMKGPAR